MRPAHAAVAAGLAAVFACAGSERAAGTPLVVEPRPEVASDGSIDLSPAADAGTEAAPPVLAPPDPVAALANVPPVCSGGWCWRYPNIQGNRINEVYATGPDNIWLGGGRGFVMQWDGAAWNSRVLPPPPFKASQNVDFIGGTSKTDIWAGGGNTLYHWDGASWALRLSFPPGVDQSLSHVWVAPGGDVWVTADYGVVYHATNGGEFAPMPTGAGQLGTIWGLADDDFWITARPGVLMHADGKKFDVVPTNTLKTLDTVWGAAKNDVWVSGLDGVLFHWDGAALTPISSGTNQNISYVRGRGPNDIWMLGHGRSQKSTQLHWDGAKLELVPNPFEVSGGRLDPSGIALAGDRLWVSAASASLFVHEPATGWTQVVKPARSKANAVWGRANDDLWTAGPSGIQHWDGKGWKDESLATTAGGINAMSGAYDQDHLDVWAVGQGGKVHHFDGTAWTLNSFPGEYFYGVWAPTVGEVFVVGAGDRQPATNTGPRIHHFANGAWTTIDASGTTEELLSVWGPSKDAAWIGGAKGTLLTWSVTSPGVLTPTTSPTALDLTAIHGAGGTTWITTNGGVVLKNEGAGFAPITIPDALGLDAVVARSATDVYFSGSIGSVFHYDGTTFESDDPRVEDTVGGLWTAVGANLWAVSGSGVQERIGK